MTGRYQQIAPITLGNMLGLGLRGCSRGPSREATRRSAKGYRRRQSAPMGSLCLDSFRPRRRATIRQRKTGRGSIFCLQDVVTQARSHDTALYARLVST
jgi:hypothetical protein